MIGVLDNAQYDKIYIQVYITRSLVQSLGANESYPGSPKTIETVAMIDKHNTYNLKNYLNSKPQNLSTTSP